MKGNEGLCECCRALLHNKSPSYGYMILLIQELTQSVVHIVDAPAQAKRYDDDDDLLT